MPSWGASSAPKRTGDGSSFTRHGYCRTYGFFDRIKESLTRTKQQFVERFEEAVRGAGRTGKAHRPVDVETIEALEEALISADVGVAATERIVEAVRARPSAGERCATSSRARSRDLEGAEPPANARRPHVVMIVGVNGTGKTTTVGKLAQSDQGAGRRR